MKALIQQFNDWIDRWQNTKWVQRLNVTSQVIWNLLLIIAVITLLGSTFVGAAGAGYFVSLVEDEHAYSAEEMKAEIYDYEETSEVYFANEQFMGELPSILDRREIDLADMSDYVIEAIISTEDEYFYEHSGIVPKAVMRATYQEFANTGVQTGGSTLTQQIVKNQMLSNEVSFDRKAREMVLAMRLENYLEKDEILEAYLNIVPFGRNSSGTQIAGVQAASHGIFGVEAADLNLPQAAFIAGLPQNPFAYSPFEADGDVKDDLSAGTNRMYTVLARMLESGAIDETMYEEARNYDIEADFTSAEVASIIERYPYITHETERRASFILRDILMEEDDIDIGDYDGDARTQVLQEYLDEARTKLRLGGYRIHTTVVQDIYVAMEDAIDNDALFGPDNELGEPEEIGASLIDNRTGAILSFVGGRDFNRENLNHATQGYRPIGSTIKPLMPYGSAMDRGIVQPAVIVPDVPTYYPPPNSDTQISNFGNGYRGLIPVRDSLMYSQNIPSVRTMLQVPVEEARQDLEKMGYTTIPEDGPYPSSALGAIDATVEQNTNAMSLFGNEGKRQESYMIERIETHNGDIVYEHEGRSHEVFSPQTAYLAIDMMRDVISSGTASSLRSMMNFGGDWAGKTGTSDDYHDSWFIGFNPQVTFGVWIGYDHPQPLVQQYNGLSYSQRTQQLWATMMNAASDTDNSDLILTDASFEMPEGVVRQSICGISGKLPSQLCHDAGFVYTDLFNSAYLPSETDDSLEGTAYVTINNQNYRAYEDTPSEFTDTGISVQSSFFDDLDLTEYMSEDLLGNIVPNRMAPSLDHQPSAVSGISASSSTLSWSQHPDHDIVGYRIYSGGSLVASVKGNTTTSYSGISSGSSYYVTAVDTRGRESNQNESGGSSSAPEVNPDDDVPDEVESDDSSGNGSGDDDGDSGDDNPDVDNDDDDSDDDDDDDNDDDDDTDDDDNDDDNDDDYAD